MNIAVILSGGLGLRMNQDGELPKQFFALGEKPILLHTLECFERHPEVDAICIVCLKTWEDYLWKLIEQYKIKKVKWITAAGSVRQESVYNGLCRLEGACPGDTMVIVHDGVRPFITHEIISKNMAVAAKCGNAMTGMNSTDTLVVSDNGKTATHALERSSAFTVQTPQTYRLNYGLNLYRRAMEKGIVDSINCCELFIAMGEEIHIVNGRKTNIKLTTKDDMAYLEFLSTIFHYDDVSDE